MEQLDCHWTDVHAIWIWEFLEILSRKFKFHYNLTITGTAGQELFTCIMMPRSTLLTRVEMPIRRQNQTQIFLSHTAVSCNLILSKFFYSPTDAQVNCLKNNFKIYIKINIKTAPTCFGAVTPSSGSALLVLANVTVVKIANYGTSVCCAVVAATSPHTTHSIALPDDGVTAPKHVGAVLMLILM